MPIFDGLTSRPTVAVNTLQPVNHVNPYVFIPYTFLSKIKTRVQIYRNETTAFVPHAARSYTVIVAYPVENSTVSYACSRRNEYIIVYT